MRPGKKDVAILLSLKLILHLKIDGWKATFFWDGQFSGTMLVLGSVGAPLSKSGFPLTPHRKSHS